MNLLQIRFDESGLHRGELLNRLSSLPGSFVLEVSPISAQALTDEPPSELVSGLLLLCKDQFTIDRAVVMITALVHHPHELSARKYDLPDSATVTQPVFVVGAPFSGGGIVVDAWRKSSETWVPGSRMPRLLELVCGVIPGVRGNSDRLDPTSVSLKQRSVLRSAFLGGARNSHGTLYADLAIRPDFIRLTEAWPRNCFRIALLDLLFPDSFFVFIHRDPASNIAAMIEGWQQPANLCRTAMGRRWSFVLPPGWEQVLDRPIDEIVAFQWAAANSSALDALKVIPRLRWCVLRYEQLLEHPAQEIHRIGDFVGLAVDSRPWSVDPRTPALKQIVTIPRELSEHGIIDRLVELEREAKS